jgi:hypothetical protein
VRCGGHEGSAFANGFVPIIKLARSCKSALLSSVAFLPSTWDEPARRPLPDAHPLILDFPASKTQKCIFVVATQTDEKHLLRVVVSTKFIIIVVG